MILIVLTGMFLLGGTTWLALERPVARDIRRNEQLTAVGVILCLAFIAATIVAALTLP